MNSSKWKRRISLPALLRMVVAFSLGSMLTYMLTAPKSLHVPPTGDSLTNSKSNIVWRGGDDAWSRSADEMECVGEHCHNILIVVVLSAPSNFAQRRACRETWFKFAKNARAAKLPVLLRFAVGDVSERAARQMSTRERLDEEQREYGDLLRVPFEDQYERLTRKTLSILRWAQSVPGSYEFLVKCDDDSFVRVDRLAHLLHSHYETNRTACHERFYFGFFNIGAQPIHDVTHRWNDDTFRDADHYPPYSLGTAYALSHALVSAVTLAHDSGEEMPMLPMEDVSVGVWVSRVGANRRYCRLEALWNVVPFVESHVYTHEYVARCTDKMIVRSHCHHYAEMYRLFSNYLQCGRQCECCEHAQKGWDDRYAARKERRRWYAQQREERRQLEASLYASMRLETMAPVIDVEPVDDVVEWSTVRVDDWL